MFNKCNGVNVIEDVNKNQVKSAQCTVCPKLFFIGWQDGKWAIKCTVIESSRALPITRCPIRSSLLG